MKAPLETDSGNKNLTSWVNVGAYTVVTRGFIATVVDIGTDDDPLDGTGGTFGIKITKHASDNIIREILPRVTFAVDAGVKYFTCASAPVLCEVDDSLDVYILSPNGADTDVYTKCRYYGVGPLQPVTAGREAAIDASGHVTLANGAHGGAAAGLTLADYAAFKAAGFSTHSAADAGTDAASKVLATPAQLLATDASGHVTAGTVSDKTDYSLSTAGVAAIWNALTSGLTTVESIGKWFLDTMLLRTTWTDARAGYVDKLNVSGTLAHSDAAATYKATGFATPTNVTDAQTVVTNAITALNNLSAAQVNAEADTALADYDPPTKTELDAAQAALAVAIAALNNLSSAQAQTAATAALNAYDPPTKTEQDTAFTTIKGATWAAGTDTLEKIRDAITPIGAGAGAITFTYTLKSSVDASAIADAEVWVTSDIAGSTLVASGRTNASGVVVFYLDPATYYVWRRKSGWDFTNPDTEVVA